MSLSSPARERILGWIQGERPGPMFIGVGGMHGNEPAGVQALERVIDTLDSRGPSISGDFVALAGNTRALHLGQRFIHHDLNRAWTTEGLSGGDPESGPWAAEPPRAEDVERHELHQLLGRVIARARGPVYILDIHTTSGGGGAFTTVGDSLANRSFALNIPVPLVLGLEELVHGTLVGYLSQFGYTTAVFECGQHEEAEAVRRAEAAVWIALKGAGVLPGARWKQVLHGTEYLRAECHYLPKVLEMRYRHAIGPDDGYRTVPGFRNFQPILEGDVIGQDRGGDVRAPQSGRVLMPLYQVQGEDGFFVIREFSRLWLFLSKALRGLGVAKVAHWLPGVHKDPKIPGALAANRNVARWYALELFHLLGYRRHVEEADRLVVVGRGPRDGGPVPLPSELP